MFKRILFPTNNSDLSNKALKFVIEIAQKFEAEVIVFFSFTGLTNTLEEIIDFRHRNAELEKELIFSYQSVLDDIKEEIMKKGITAKVLLTKGDAGKGILEAINSENCDLVIMGSRELSRIKGLLIGSTGNYVIHHTKCPVLLIN